MGSSDPLLAEFEIQFGSLNFQAMGNDYLMRHQPRRASPVAVDRSRTGSRHARC
jgi:hypothetical protein